MGSKFLSLNSLMERKNPKDGTDEQLAIVKAAAWAWYQHGSGSEAKAAKEFETARSQRAPRPSRYKLEAMTTGKELAKEGTSPDHSKRSLLDAYEVQSIAKLLDSFTEQSGRIHGVSSANEGRRKQKKMMMRRGFWLSHGVVCGAREDVVDGRAARDVRIPATSSSLVNLAKCMPRAYKAF